MFMIILQDRVIGSKNNIDEAVKLAKSTALDSGMETTVVKAQKTVQIQAVVFDLEEPKVEVNHPVKSVEEALDKMAAIIENSQGDVNIVLTPEIEGQTNILELESIPEPENEKSIKDATEDPITSILSDISEIETTEKLELYLETIKKEAPNLLCDQAVKTTLKDKRAFLDKVKKEELKEIAKAISNLIFATSKEELEVVNKNTPDKYKNNEYKSKYETLLSHFNKLTPQKEQITESNFVDLNITIARKYGDCYTIDQLNVERDFFINKYENISELAWFKEMYHAQVRVIDKNRKK